MQQVLLGCGRGLTDVEVALAAVRVGDASVLNLKEASVRLRLRDHSELFRGHLLPKRWSHAATLSFWRTITPALTNARMWMQRGLADHQARLTCSVAGFTFTLTHYATAITLAIVTLTANRRTRRPSSGA